jgi:transposase-like protein
MYPTKGIFLPGARRGRKHNRFLYLVHAERQSGDAFPDEALNRLQNREKPEVINTDKAPTYGIAITEMKVEANALRARCNDRLSIWTSVFEADHGG